MLGSTWGSHGHHDPVTKGTPVAGQGAPSGVTAPPRINLCRRSGPQGGGNGVGKTGNLGPAPAAEGRDGQGMERGGQAAGLGTPPAPRHPPAGPTARPLPHELGTSWDGRLGSPRDGGVSGSPRHGGVVGGGGGAMSHLVPCSRLRVLRPGDAAGADAAGGARGADPRRLRLLLHRHLRGQPAGQPLPRAPAAVEEGGPPRRQRPASLRGEPGALHGHPHTCTWAPTRMYVAMGTQHTHVCMATGTHCTHVSMDTGTHIYVHGHGHPPHRCAWPQAPTHTGMGMGTHPTWVSMGTGTHPCIHGYGHHPRVHGHGHPTTCT